MAARSKVQDSAEIRRWIEEGKTYKWMVEQYAEKYDLEVSPSLFANFRRRNGMETRITSDTDLIPWFIEKQHRHAWAAQMLRAEARRRGGKPLPEKAEAQLNTFLEGLRADNAVIHYDPETEAGFHYVHPREGIDTDLIFVPDKVTRVRGNADDQDAAY